jgi:hypothetical protein
MDKRITKIDNTHYILYLNQFLGGLTEQQKVQNLLTQCLSLLNIVPEFDGKEEVEINLKMKGTNTEYNRKILCLNWGKGIRWEVV